MTIHDTSGNDTLDFSSFTADDPITVHLDTTGTSQQIHDVSDTTELDITLDSSSSVKNVLGGEGNDQLYGTSAANLLAGGGGDDILYGGNGDDVYRFSPGDAGSVTIHDTAGTDTLDFSQFSDADPVTIDLATRGSFQTVHTIDESTSLQLEIASSVDLENVTGGAGNDTIYGNGLTNGLNGGDGDDTYIFRQTDAGAVTVQDSGGADTLDFSSFDSSHPITLDLNTINSSQSVDSAGLHVTLATGTDLENILGGAGADHLYGTDGDNLLAGGGGNDYLYGREGNDTYVFAPTDTGTVNIVDTAGIDTLDFSQFGSGDGVTVDLPGRAATTASGPSVVIDSATDIENVLGGAGDDTIYGNGLPNTLTGNGGDDYLYGGDGDDLFVFKPTDSGTVTVNDTDGNDTFDFSQFGADDPIYANLLVSTISADTGPEVTIDSSTIENVIGGAGDDTIFTGVAGATLVSNGGSDTLVGYDADTTFLVNSLDPADHPAVYVEGGAGNVVDLSGNGNAVSLDIGGWSSTLVVDGNFEIQIGVNGGGHPDLHISGDGELDFDVGSPLLGTSISVSASTVNFTHDYGNGYIDLSVVDGGNVIFDNSQFFNSLTLDGGFATVAANGGYVLKVNALSIAADSALDLNDNGLILDYSGTSPAADVNALVARAYNPAGATADDHWLYDGLTSSSAYYDPDQITSLGVLDNDQSGGLVSTFFGKSVDADSILVRDTYTGDVNLDGVIDGYDATTYGSAGWEHGDFNYDAAVDSADAALQTAASAAQGLQKVDFPPLFVAESAEPISVDLGAYFLDPVRSNPHWTYSVSTTSDPNSLLDGTPTITDGVLTVAFNSATAGSATISVTAQNDDGVSISNALSVSTYAEFVTETDPTTAIPISVADGATPSVIHFENADATVALTIGSGAAAVDLAVVGTFDLSVQSTSSGPFALVLTGEGDFSVAGWTDLPSGSSFEIDGGTAHFTDDLAAEGANLAVTVDNGGDVSFESTQHLASLTLTDGTATLAEGKDKVLVLGALSINLDSAWLDLQNNGLIVNYSGTSPLATITGYIASAYTTVGAAHWQGTGLTSSWAAYDPAGATGLGIIENHQGGSNIYSTFLGESVGSSSILIRYTHDGDLNLDGKVDGNELYEIANESNTHPSGGWEIGDSDYNGVIDSNDMNSVNASYWAQHPTAQTIPDVEVTENAAAETIDLWDYFSDPLHDPSQLTFTVSSNSDGSLVTPTFDDATGEMTLSFAADADGTADISIHAVDPDGNSVNSVAFTTTVDHENQAPTLDATPTAGTYLSVDALGNLILDVSQTGVAHTSQSVSFTVTASDPDSDATDDGTLTFSLTSHSGSVLSVSESQTDNTHYVITATFNTDVASGSPTVYYVAPAIYDFTVHVEDGDGTPLSDDHTYYLEVGDPASANNYYGDGGFAPIAHPDQITLPTDGTTNTISIDAAHGVLGNDTKGESSNTLLQPNLVAQAAHGTVTLNADGSFDYVPDGSGDFTGDSFTYYPTAHNGDLKYGAGDALSGNTVTVNLDFEQKNVVSVDSKPKINLDGSITFTIRLGRDSGSTTTVQVPYMVSIGDTIAAGPDQTATDTGADFPMTGTAVFSGGQTTVLVRVPVRDLYLAETYHLTLLNTSGLQHARLDAAHTTVAIDSNPKTDPTLIAAQKAQLEKGIQDRLELLAAHGTSVDQINAHLTADKANLNTVNTDLIALAAEAAKADPDQETLKQLYDAVQLDYIVFIEGRIQTNLAIGLALNQASVLTVSKYLDLADKNSAMATWISGLTMTPGELATLTASAKYFAKQLGVATNTVDKAINVLTTTQRISDGALVLLGTGALIVNIAKCAAPILAQEGISAALKFGATQAVEVSAQMAVANLANQAGAAVARKLGASDTQIEIGQRVFGTMAMIYEASKARCFAAGTQIALADRGSRRNIIAYCAAGAALLALDGFAVGDSATDAENSEDEFDEEIPDSHRGREHI